MKTKITKDDIKIMKYLYNQWNLSIGRIAESVGISREYASRLIHDKYRIQEKNLKKINNKQTNLLIDSN